MAARPAGRHTPSGGDNVPRAQVAVDDVLDVDEPDVLDEDDEEVEDAEVPEEVDVLDGVVESDDVVDPLSFFVSPEPFPAAAAEAVLAAARESVL